MKFLTKVSASFLLSFGFLCIIASFSQLSELGDKDNIPEQQQEATEGFLGCIGLGVPMLAGGGWMFWDLRRKHRKQLSQNLDSTFYQILQAQDGRITVLRLAMETQLSGEEARKYLDQKAKEFNASFETTEKGDISYHFYV